MKNDPLLMEIQEEINRENMVRFINKYGKVLAVVGVLIVLGLGGFQAWKSYKNKASIAAGDKIYTVMRDSNQPQDEFAIKTLEEVAKTSGYKEIAYLNEARIHIKNNKFAEAVNAYDKIAKDKSADKTLSDLAGLNAANILLNTNPKAEGLEKRLTDLTAEDNAFKYSAMELLAAFYMQNNNQAKANEVLDKLAGEANVPVTISKRARELSTTKKEPAAAQADEE